MKDLMNLVRACQADLDFIGIKYGRVREWSVNTRAKSRWGQCKKVGFDLFDISISDVLLNDDVDEQLTKNTIVHELLHTVSGCFGHKGKWKKLAGYVMLRLPQYNIKRVTSFEEVGIGKNSPESIYRYILRCSGCGKEIKRQRKSKVISNHKKYRCAKCGGRLERLL